MTNPYLDLDDKAFWKLAVANRSAFDLADLWQPKFQLEPNDRVVTFGSCFAQHIGKALKKNGYNWTSYESAPPQYKRYNSANV